MQSILADIISPVSGNSPIKIEDDKIIFSESETYIIIDGIPVIINEEAGLFTLNDILINTPTTQSARHNDVKNWKNYFRKRVLPSLTNDKYFTERYKWLGKVVTGKVLVIGAGDKSEYYRKIFPTCTVITSDVHRQFAPDIIFDAHAIPFKNDTFNLVIAGQVLEHTMKPWVVASEIERVLKPMGMAHIETPVNFPFHAHPYDFYRFTFTGLRSLFSHCNVQKSFVTEGNGSTVAVMNSELLINFFSNRYLRQIALVTSRILFSWFKYFGNDAKDSVKNIRRLAIPKGIGFTFQFDGRKRSSKELLMEYYEIAKHK